jgi:hypothetical protein
VNLEIFMQAKNYAAQILSAKNDNTTSELRTIIHPLKHSVIFNLPHGGYLTIDLNVSSRNCDFSSVERPPFDNIFIQFDTDINKFGILVAYEPQEDAHIGFIFFGMRREKEWHSLPYVFCVKKQQPHEPVYLNRYFDSENDDHKDSAIFCMCVYNDFLTALSCRNIEQTITQKCDPALNARRINKGKLPLYEERILTIKVNAKQSTGTRTGTHESPRQHLRRGHIRRLESGNIWVNACVVGSSEKGVIKKCYNVAA